MSGRVVAGLIAALVVVGCACGVGGFALGAVVTNHHSVVDQRRGGPQFNQYGNNRPGPFNGGPRGRVRQQQPTPQPSAS